MTTAWVHSWTQTKPGSLTTTCVLYNRLDPSSPCRDTTHLHLKYPPHLKCPIKTGLLNGPPRMEANALPLHPAWAPLHLVGPPNGLLRMVANALLLHLAWVPLHLMPPLNGILRMVANAPLLRRVWVLLPFRLSSQLGILVLSANPAGLVDTTATLDTQATAWRTVRSQVARALPVDVLHHLLLQVTIPTAPAFYCLELTLSTGARQ
jgi:hypothetical protein